MCQYCDNGLLTGLPISFPREYFSILAKRILFLKCKSSHAVLLFKTFQSLPPDFRIRVHMLWNDPLKPSTVWSLLISSVSLLSWQFSFHLYFLQSPNHVGISHDSGGLHVPSYCLEYPFFGCLTSISRFCRVSQASPFLTTQMGLEEFLA